jgi:hypothetical protein
MQRIPTKVPTGADWASTELAYKLLKGLEARAGIEPAHKGFADLSLTTWVVPRQNSIRAKEGLDFEPGGLSGRNY